LQLNDLLKDHTIIYENADSVFSSKTHWLKDRWLEARLKVQDQKKVIFIIDEVQSIPDWSRMIKGLWDQDKRQKNLFHVVLLAPAFMSLFGDTDKGRKFELMIGLELLKKYEEVFYWREGNAEVDFVIKHKKKIIGIEVKSGNKRDTRGLEIFGSTFKAKTLLITLENFERLHDLIEAL